jgi:endonuclease-3
MKANYIIENLELMFKDAHCELNYNNDWQLLIAILLSAQCTDKKVNAVTPILFSKYPTLKDLKNAKYEDIEKIIHPLGLSHNKTKNILSLAAILHNNYNDKVPSEKEELIKLPGIGTKTANVMLIEYFKIPAFPVDTHVARVSKRLNICDESDNVKQIENKLTKKFKEDSWALLHLRMVLFGRYICKAIKPDCNNCLFNKVCTYKKK